MVVRLIGATNWQCLLEIQGKDTRRLGFCMVMSAVMWHVSCGRSIAVEQNNAADEPDGIDSEVVDNLRAALDVERSTTQQLTENLQQEQERVSHLTTQLTRLSEQFTAERSVTAQLRNNMESMAVSHLLQLFSIACSW